MINKKQNLLYEIYDMFARLGMNEVQPLNEDDSHRLVHKSSPHQEIENFQPINKPIIAYRQFKMKLDRNGNNLTPGVVYPLYVNTASEGTNGGLKIGKWYKAGEGECWENLKNGLMQTKGKGYNMGDNNTIQWLSYRPGWHSTSLPWGNQRGAKQGEITSQYTHMRDNEVWAKIEICIDNDLTELANSMGSQAKLKCLSKMEDNGYYIYKTNTNATDYQIWYICDKIRIVEILDDNTVDAINDEAYSDENVRKMSNGKLTVNRNPNIKTQKKQIPYWHMPRLNGRRYTKDDLKNMGYV